MLAMAYSLSTPCSNPESVQDEQPGRKSLSHCQVVVYTFGLPVFVPFFLEEQLHFRMRSW